jgi:hypothetical protein
VSFEVRPSASRDESSGTATLSFPQVTPYVSASREHARGLYVFDDSSRDAHSPHLTCGNSPNSKRVPVRPSASRTRCCVCVPSPRRGVGTLPTCLTYLSPNG